ncbi:glyoxalase/bleomycin resistance protein/dioxygenase superfamily protein [Aliiruegeria haliotis]|uniref:Glyoxalase/bleomycin resistance protein/dioxygenase superfamily protein n=1 Tax=Aliiruegeria haliotis TaxID=1280846 RepID=A0A2T0RN31_9RHOB|nr:VOC family protein [Aliiruegeria haliotis]PRY22532.1 glyoxalase/bleomycin resistance protein/dioxygenase superfamily protein [Aliiruegeria haliotis]
MIEGIDHVVLAVRDLDRATAIYARVLNMQVETFAKTRKALMAGDQKINLQVIGQENRNHACIGSGDICLLTRHSPAEVRDRLEAEGVAILEGPFEKTGALGPITSVYFNDPDGNLVEVSSYAKTIS